MLSIQSAEGLSQLWTPEAIPPDLPRLTTVPGLAEKYRLYDSYLGKMENALAHQAWLAGDTFSLADVAMTPYVNRLDMLGMSEMWTKSRPLVTDWFSRIRSRPAFKPALLDWCSPDLIADLLTFGRQSWPSVQRMLQ
jgi:ganglioside-induced differentiation-associated protein 1